MSAHEGLKATMKLKSDHILFRTALTALLSFAILPAANAEDDAVPYNSSTQNVTPPPFTPRLTLNADETHSGLKLPRWVSLKYGTVNGRKGPGKNFPHLWTFQRKSMPVIVINEMDHWRKIRDIEGGESWVRSVALSGEKTAIVMQSTPLLKSKKHTSRALAQLDPNVLLKISECGEIYCTVEIDLEVSKGKKKGPKGYVRRGDLWGIQGFK